MNRRQFVQAVSWFAALATGRLPVDATNPGKAGLIPRLDLIGDPIPPRALTRVGTTRFWDRPSIGRIESMAVSPDGGLIATSNTHDPVTLWDATTGQVIRRLGPAPAKRLGFSYERHGLAFTADSKTVAVGRPGRELLHEEIHPHRKFERPGGKIERWDVATGRQLTSFNDSDEPIFGIAYAGDGSLMVTFDRQGSILVRDPESVEIQHRIEVKGLEEIALTADGSVLLTGGYGCSLTLWDTATGEPRRSFTLPELTEPAHWCALAITPDGRTVAASRRTTIDLWDAATGEHRLSIAAEAEDATHKALRRPYLDTLSFAPNGRTLASAGSSDRVRLWDLSTGTELAPLGSINGSAVGVAFGPAGRSLVAVGSWGSIRVWDLATRVERVRSSGHQSSVGKLAWSADGATVVSVSDDALCVARADTGVEIQHHPLPVGDFCDFALASNGRWLAYQETRNDRRIVVIEISSGAISHRFDSFSPEYGSLCFQFAADGQTLIVSDEQGADQVFLVFDLASGRMIQRIVSAAWKPEMAELSRYSGLIPYPTGGIVASLASLRGFDDTILVHDRATGELRHQFELPLVPLVTCKPHPDSFQAAALTADGSRLAAIDGVGTVRIWEVEQGREIGRWETRLFRSQKSLAIDPNGKVLATSSTERGKAGTIELRDVASGRELARLEGHEGAVESLAFSPDGRRLASGSADTTVLIWDVAEWS